MHKRGMSRQIANALARVQDGPWSVVAMVRDKIEDVVCPFFSLSGCLGVANKVCVKSIRQKTCKREMLYDRMMVPVRAPPNTKKVLFGKTAVRTCGASS